MSKTMGLILTEDWTQKEKHPNMPVIGTSGVGKGFVPPLGMQHKERSKGDGKEMCSV